MSDTETHDGLQAEFDAARAALHETWAKFRCHGDPCDLNHDEHTPEGRDFDVMRANRRLSNRSWDEDLRLEQAIHLGLAYLDNEEGVDNDLEDLLEDCSDVGGIPEFVPLAEMVSLAMRDAEREESSLYRPQAWAETLIDYGVFGWILKVSTPVLTPIKPGSDLMMMSWGFRALIYVYGETFEEAYERAFTEVEKVKAQARERAKADVEPEPDADGGYEGDIDLDREEE